MFLKCIINNTHLLYATLSVLLYATLSVLLYATLSVLFSLDDDPVSAASPSMGDIWIQLALY